MTSPILLQFGETHSEVVRVFAPRNTQEFTNEDRQLLLTQAREAGLILPMGENEKSVMRRYLCRGALLEAILLQKEKKSGKSIH